MGQGPGGRDRAGRLDSAELDRLINEAKDAHNLSDLVSQYTDLKKDGPHELKGLCPFHSERTPSFRVSDEKGFYFCFGCGAAGDHINFIRAKHGVGLMKALRHLTGSELPRVDPSERARRRQVAIEQEASNQTAAISMFAQASWVEDTAGEDYLRARGIDRMPEVGGTVRFGMVPAWQNPMSGEWGKNRPALVCGCQDVNGNFTGIQRIFVDGPKPGKAAVKLTLGRIRGSALRLDKPEAEIIVTEGPEDGLSLRQMLPDTPVWVACGTGLLPAIEFPPVVESIIIAGQNDDPGRTAVQTAAEAYIARGLKVRSVFPEMEGHDWNDELRTVAVQ